VTKLVIVGSSDAGISAALRAREVQPAARIDLLLDTIATALHNRMTVEELNDLDLSYSPPFSAPWDPVRPPPKPG
jgi:hypothetical protein